MRKLLFFLATVYLCHDVQSQTSESEKLLEESLSLLKQEKYYPAIRVMNSLAQEYPSAPVYYNRGLAKMKLFDFTGARNDFKKAKDLGFDDGTPFLNFFTSERLMVDKLAQPYTDPSTLDSARGYKSAFGPGDSIRGALRPERTCYDVRFYNLTVKVIPRTRSIDGSNQISFRTTGPTSKIQVDLADNYTIHSITLDGKALAYTRMFDALFIDLGQTLGANQDAAITITYSGKPRQAPLPPWNPGFTWKRSRFSWWVGVSCEHLGASCWWPCKDHLSDKPDSMRVNIQVPGGYMAVSNGNLRSTTPLDESYTNFEWFVSYPINSYGVTFYMGKFVNFREMFTNHNGSYPIDYYVLPHHLKAARKMYSQTSDILATYEKLYGEYPYKNDGVGMVEAPFSGMEHQGAIAIGDEYNGKSRRNYGYNYLLVHETAHEWWGNTVTMGDMADAWISESFATYSEHLFLEEKLGHEAYLDAVASNMLDITNIWPMVGTRDVNDNTFIGGDIYTKGAAMLNNLRCCIDNDSLFFSIIRTFFNEFKFKIATTPDFINLVNRETGGDYTDFFQKSLHDAEPPVLEYSFHNINDSLVLTYKWVNVGKNFAMPFSITVNGTETVRLEGTAEPRTFVQDSCSSFYLVNPLRYREDRHVAKNAFTYYWTSWKQ